MLGRPLKRQLLQAARRVFEKEKECETAMGGGGAGRGRAALTEAEALVFRSLALVLAVDGGGVPLLTGVVAASVSTADPPAHHRGEDDLDAVQAGGEVGAWQGGQRLGEEVQEE